MPEDRPQTHILKRFANLDIDGVPSRPNPPDPKPAKAPAPVARARPEQDPDELHARALAAELTANARTTAAQTTPEARRMQRAEARIRATPPSPSRPMPAPSGGGGPPTAGVRSVMVPMATRRAAVEPVGIVPRMVPRDAPELTPTRLRPGVEADGPVYSRTIVGTAVSGAPRAPIELSPAAARQVMLMAHEAGVTGSGLRVMTSDGPGPGVPECDFAFDDTPEPDDVVFLSEGVRIIVDRDSLMRLSGRRITWHDVPGREGFAIR